MPAANDDFSNAQVITGGSGTVAFDLTGASSESGEPTPANGETVWFTWTAPASGTVWFDTMLSTGDPDTYLSVYTGSSVGSLTLVTDDDDSGNNPAVGNASFGTSKLSFTALNGTTYKIQVDGYDTGITGTLRWGTSEPALPPPAPHATSWSEAAGRDYHTVFPGDDIVIIGTHLDAVDTVSIGGHPQPFTATDSTHITVHVDTAARSGHVTVANISGSDDTNDGDATVLFAGPWIQPPDQVTSDPNFAGAWYGPTSSEIGANIYPTQPDIEGAPVHPGSGAYTAIAVANRKLSDPGTDPEFDWNLAGGLVLSQANLPQYAMPPIDYAPIIAAAGDTLWSVESENPAGVAVTDISVSFRAADLSLHEWSDSTDHKSATDISGDLWQTGVEFRRLTADDWTQSGPTDVELSSGAWPSKSWLAVLPLEVTIDLVASGDTLTISTEEDAAPDTRVDNRATHDGGERLVPAATLTWDEYAAGVAWAVALDRLIDADPISVPYVQPGVASPLQRKTVSAEVSLVMTWTYRPPRYRLLYEEPPVLTKPPLRQWPRDDGLRRGPGRTQPTSRQGSLRRGPRGTYT